MARKRNTREHYAAEFDQHKDRVAARIASWIEQHPNLDIEMSRWDSPDDYIHSFSFKSSKARSAEVAIALWGCDVFVPSVNGLYIFPIEQAYSEKLVFQILKWVSLGHVRIYHFPYYQTVELGEGESAISHDNFYPGLKGFLKRFCSLFSQQSRTPLRVEEFESW